MKVYLETFGCTFNQGDSQIIAGLLTGTGFKMVETPDKADLIILNTCYVKLPTEQKIINRVKDLISDFPENKLLIAGCMVEIDPEKLNELAPESNWIGPHHIKSITQVVRSIQEGKTVRLTGFHKDRKVELPKLRSNPLIHIIQICEGCEGSCSYCCTRLARGMLFSYPKESIIREAQKAVAEGCVELQLTAQDTAAYGRDMGITLSQLIEPLTQLEGRFRVRIGMMHPQNMLNDADDLIRVFKDDKIYKFLHMPLQSGNDDVLSDMNRNYNINDFLRVVHSFQREIPSLSLATDIIVGYPTEDEDAFQDTLKIIEKIRPDFLHISKYNHRPGAASSQLPELNPKIIKKRSKALNELKERISYEKNRELIGTVQKILITSKGHKGGFLGRTASYKTVIIKEAKLGSMVEVKITEAKSTYLKGELIDHKS